MTRTNAAIGLSRNDSAEGIPVFIELIRGAKDWDLDPNQVKTEEGKSTYFERMLILINSMKALSQVHEKLSADQKQTLTQLLEILSDQTQDAVLKSQILELKQTL